MSSDEGYLLDNRQTEAMTRFAALAELVDPGTLRRIDELGIARAGSTARRGALRIVRHDVGTDAPPGEGFDLVHARLVLTTFPRASGRSPRWSPRCGPAAGSDHLPAPNVTKRT